MMDAIDLFLEEIDAISAVLPLDDRILGTLILLLSGYVFWRGGQNMLKRGRGGEMSRNGSAAVVLGALSYLAATVLIVNTATGWSVKRSLIAAMGLLLALVIGYRTGALGKVARPIAAKVGLYKPAEISSDEPQIPPDIGTFQSFIQATDATEFEKFAGWIAQQKGFEVTHTGQPGDGGIDLELHKDGLFQLIQCKRYTDRAVTVGEVRDFYGAMTAAGADHGYIITTSKFTKDARRWAETKTGKRITLMDRASILPWVEEWTQRPLTVTCKYCGAENRPSALYCAKCGAPRP